MLLTTLTYTPSTTARAEEEAKAPEPPKVLMCAPLGGVTGQTIPVKARGLRLEGTTEITSHTAGVTAKFLSHSKVGVPGGTSAERAGDTQVEFELTLAAEVTAEAAGLEFITPHGNATYQLPLGEAARTILEIEPNPGYQQPQEISFPQVVLGQIERVHDVDVYAIEFAADQWVQIDVAAQTHGSVLDPLASLVDWHGTTLASNDDYGGSRDSRIETRIAEPGRYFIVVQDANDQGGEAQPYRLSVSPGAPPVSFVNQVAPILQQHCVACHGPDKAEGGYRVDSFQHLISAGDSSAKGFVPHRAGDSESFRRITSDDPGQRMPLDSDPLNDDQIALIKTWLEQGASFDGEDATASLISLAPPVVHPDAPSNYSAPLPLAAIAFSPDGNELLVGGYHELTIWDPADGKLLRRVGQLAQRTYAIAWHPSGAQFAVACGNPGQLGEVRLLSRSGDLQKLLCASADVIHDIAYSPGGNEIAIALSDGSVRVYDLELGKLRQEITSHLDWVLAVAWSPDGSKLASGSRDKTAKVFDSQSGQLLASYNRHDAPVRGVLFHPGGEEVYSAGGNGRWDRWKVGDAQRVRDMHLGGEAFKIFGIGSSFFIASANGRVHMMKAQESDRIRELQTPGDVRLISTAAHEATDRVAAGSHRGEVTLWELSTGNKLAEFRAAP